MAHHLTQVPRLAHIDTVELDAGIPPGFHRRTDGHLSVRGPASLLSLLLLLWTAATDYLAPWTSLEYWLVIAHYHLLIVSRYEVLSP